MNFQTAGIVGGAAFLLSTLAGLIGGVPFLDVVLRAVFWALIGFGLSLGVEAAMRSLLPDLFVPSEPTEEPQEAAPDRRVDITLDEERPESVFEEVDEEEPVVAPRRAAQMAAVPEPEVETRPAVANVDPTPGAEEEMPEIGAFLDAFKPNAPEDEGEEGSSAPEYAEYAPVETQPERRSSGKVSMDGEEQDPVILAKAIQTVMKRDGQGT